MWADIITGAVIGLACGVLPGAHPNSVALFTSKPHLLVAASGSFIPAGFLSFTKFSGNSDSFRLSLAGALLASVAFLLVLSAIPPLREINSVISGRAALFLAMIALSNIVFDRAIPSAFLFLLSGGLGLAVLNLPIPQNDKLFPLLTGLFCLPNIIAPDSSEEYLPAKPVKAFSFLKCILIGLAAGSLVGILPATTPTVASFFITLPFSLNSSESAIVSGAAVSSALLFSLAVLGELGKARNGALVGIDLPLQLMLGIALVSLSLGAAISVFLRERLSGFSFSEGRLRALATVIVLLNLFAFTGWRGILIAVTACSLGMMPKLLQTKRTHLMGVLILPTLVHFAGYLL